jgi:hypothetical protein
VATGTPPTQTSIVEKQVEMKATETGQNKSQAAAVATTGSNETHTQTNGTTGSNETHTQTNGTTGSNETHTQTNGTTGIIKTHTQTNGTIGSNETHEETGSSETPMHADGTKTGKSESHTETNGSKTGNNETGTVSSSTQSSHANTAGAAAHDSPAEPPPVLSIFLVNDLQYDIFPVYPENGSMCDADPGKYPSMPFDVQMALRIERRSPGM